MSEIRMLALIDSPTLATGFATVGQNLFPTWLAAGAKIDVWAIGFNGMGYESWPGLRLLPAAGGGPWNATRGLEEFLGRLAQLDAAGQPLYTHVFILQDTFHFSPAFCETFEHVCTQRHIRSLMYFPVDAALEPIWTRILSAVDVAVAYTHYGKLMAERAAEKGGLRVRCEVLPHGVDRELFRPRPEQRANDRRMWAVGPEDKPVVFVRPDDFLILNVNTNQWRKDAPRSLEILAQLLGMGVPAKLVMHCRKATPYGTDLESVGRQLGLQLFRDWVHSGDLFGPGDNSFMGYDKTGRALVGSRVGAADLARMYNAADLVLSTSLGEGWGLSITEALATGTPVAIPRHTSCEEIADTLYSHDPAYARRQVCLLDASDLIVMPAEMSRVRNRVTMPGAAKTISDYWASEVWRTREGLPELSKEWLSWPRVAGRMLELLVGSASNRAAKTATKTQEVS